MEILERPGEGRRGLPEEDFNPSVERRICSIQCKSLPFSGLHDLRAANVV